MIKSLKSLIRIITIIKVNHRVLIKPFHQFTKFSNFHRRRQRVKGKLIANLQIDEARN